MTNDARLWIQCGKIELEGRLTVPTAPGPVPTVVLCHPHPLHGGDMDNRVLSAVAMALTDFGVGVLRFNFRGVGRSGGVHGGGRAEIDDAKAALAALRGCTGVDPDRLALAGYSFGAWVASVAAPGLPGVRALGCVAPPLGHLPMPAADSVAVPTAVVAGDGDIYCRASQLRSWFEGIPGPKELAVLSGADHFFGGQEGEVGRSLAPFLHRWLSAMA